MNYDKKKSGSSKRKHSEVYGEIKNTKLDHIHNAVLIDTQNVHKEDSTTETNENVCPNTDQFSYLEDFRPSQDSATEGPGDEDDNSFIRRCKPTTSSEKDYFSMIPNEVMLLMFMNFDKSTLLNCACVCMRWRDVAFDPKLWTRINLASRKLPANAMSYVMSKEPHILRMAQTEVSTPIFSRPRVNIIATRLEYLDLSMAVVSSADLVLLMKCCVSLKKLSLEHCEVNYNVCEEIAKNRNLTTLNMALCRGLSKEGLALLLKCTRLEELNVAWTKLKSNSVNILCKNITKNIVRLNLSGCQQKINDEHVKVLTNRCTKLIELDLSDSSNITEESINAIAAKLENLEILSLSRCYNIFPASYTKLFMLPALKCLNLYGLFHDTQIDSLRKSCNLKLNTMIFSTVARPTVGSRRTSIWGLAVTD